MGEKILNQVILPNNAANNDGVGFLEGVKAIRRMLLDELKRDEQRATGASQVFDLQYFLWTSKEILLALLIGLFLFYIIFFVLLFSVISGAGKFSTSRPVSSKTWTSCCDASPQPYMPLSFVTIRSSPMI